jgi:hypothetical protein
MKQTRICFSSSVLGRRYMSTVSEIKKTRAMHASIKNINPKHSINELKVPSYIDIELNIYKQNKNN